MDTIQGSLYAMAIATCVLCALIVQGRRSIGADEYGIDHFAEEYHGATWEKNWTEHGRVYDRMLPFFDRMLVFENR